MQFLKIYQQKGDILTLMGTNYSSDRAFTDYVHEHLAIPLIYKDLGWVPQSLGSRLTENADVLSGVDYFLVDTINSKIVTVQERFREAKYQYYTDFTIRFEREFNKHEERRLSEYYKLEADYFVYGIIDRYKQYVREARRFIKYAVIDLHVLKELIDEGYIIIDRNLDGLRCKALDGKLYCPVNYNRDNSSSFFPVDIKLLLLLFPKRNVVVKQEGF